MSSSGNNLVTELDKKIKAISNEETIDVFSYTCKNSCHRNRECKKDIGSGKTTKEALKCVKDFKLHIWNSTFKSGRDHRNLHLMYDLFRMQNPTNRDLFNFTIGYDLVFLELLILYSANVMFSLLTGSCVQRLLQKVHRIW